MEVTTPAHENVADANRGLQLEQVPIGVPMGFTGQLRALQQMQCEQTERIAMLEADNEELRKQLNATITSLNERIKKLEQHNEHLSVRRRELVGQLLNLRTLHLDADNAFQMRAADMQPDDAEGVIALCNTQIVTTMSHHQRAIAQIRTNSQVRVQPYPMYHPPMQPLQPTVMPPRNGRWYPHWYTKMGYCLAHSTAHPCFTCDRKFENTSTPQKTSTPQNASTPQNTGMVQNTNMTQNTKAPEKPSAPEKNPPTS